MVEAFPEDTAPRYVLRDQDKIYGREFCQRIRSLRIEEVLSAPASPWQRAYVERLVGSVRRDCLDHVIILGERHLRATLKRYLDYYNCASLSPPRYVADKSKSPWSCTANAGLAYAYEFAQPVALRFRFLAVVYCGNAKKRGMWLNSHGVSMRGPYYPRGVLPNCCKPRVSARPFWMRLWVETTVAVR